MGVNTTSTEQFPAGECVGPQGFGFADESGEVFEGRLPMGGEERRGVVAAVGANDEAAIKAALGV